MSPDLGGPAALGWGVNGDAATTPSETNRPLETRPPEPGTDE
jgi:hypothetical protein